MIQERETHSGTIEPSRSKKESYRKEFNLDFDIIGKGSIGEKARQLVEKTPKLKEMGFHAPRRTILAENFFDAFFQRNNLGANLRAIPESPDAIHKILNGSFPQEDFRTIRQICSSYGDKPLYIRSSAEGDARGTDTYKSDTYNK